MIKANNRVDARSEIREVNLARELNSAVVIRDLGSIWTGRSIAMRINIRACETRPRLALDSRRYCIRRIGLPRIREESFIQRSLCIQRVYGVSRLLFSFFFSPFIPG